jgi:hypothetical protein
MKKKPGSSLFNVNYKSVMFYQTDPSFKNKTEKWEIALNSFVCRQCHKLFTTVIYNGSKIGS